MTIAKNGLPIHILGLFDLFRKKKEDKFVETQVVKPVEPTTAKSKHLPEWLEFSAHVDYEGSGIKISVKLTNKGTELIGNPILRIVASRKIFNIKNDIIEAPSLDPGQSIEGEFLLIPVVNLKVYSPKIDIEYFDFTLKERVGYTLDIEEIIFEGEIILKPYQMSEDEFRVYVGNVSPLEIETREINMDPETLFETSSSILLDMGMYRIDPVLKAPEVYRALARFSGVDEMGDIYCVELQVIGRGDISRMLIRIWSRTGKRVTVLRSNILHVMENKMHIKEYIM